MAPQRPSAGWRRGKPAAAQCKKLEPQKKDQWCSVSSRLKAWNPPGASPVQVCVQRLRNLELASVGDGRSETRSGPGGVRLPTHTSVLCSIWVPSLSACAAHLQGRASSSGWLTCTPVVSRDALTDTPRVCFTNLVDVTQSRQVDSQDQPSQTVSWSW